MQDLRIIVSPIGNIKDISYNAISVLKELDYIYCEDTRITKKIFFKYEIRPKNKLRILNDANEKRIVKKIVNLLKLDFSIGIICDAGYPIICDPGYNLIKECYENKIGIRVIGANSALLSALILANFPPIPFMFHGFMNFSSLNKLEEVLITCVNSDWTSVFYVSKHDLKVLSTLLEKSFKCNVFAIVKEVSKIHQKIFIGLGKEIMKNFLEEDLKGEFVFLVKGSNKRKKIKGISETTKNLLTLIYKNSTKTKQLAQMISLVSKEPINEIYKYIIQLKKHDQKN